MDAYSFIGPDVFMDSTGKLYKKANDEFVRITDKYTKAEDRYIEKQARKVGNDNEKSYD